MKLSVFYKNSLLIFSLMGFIFLLNPLKRLGKSFSIITQPILPEFVLLEGESGHQRRLKKMVREKLTPSRRSGVYQLFSVAIIIFMNASLSMGHTILQMGWEVTRPIMSFVMTTLRVWSDMLKKTVP